MNKNVINQLDVNLKDGENAQQVKNKQDKNQNVFQFSQFKKIKRENQQKFSYKEESNVIISEEEKAVNKLLSISCNQEELIAEQIISEFQNDYEQIKVNSQTQVNQQFFNGWGGKYQTNYHLSALKNLCVQINSLDDLDRVEVKNIIQKDGFFSCRSEQQDKMTGNIKQIQKIKPIQLQELNHQVKQENQTNKQNYKFNNRDSRSPLETNFENQTQMSNIKKLFTPKQAEKSALFSGNLTSNEKFLQMLRKSHNKLLYQQKFNLIKDNTDQIKQEDGNIQQLKDIYLNLTIQDTINQREKQKQQDEQREEFIHLSLQKNIQYQRKSLKNQYRPILEYYNLPSPTKQFIPKNTNQDSIKPFIYNNNQYLNDHILPLRHQLQQIDQDGNLNTPQQIQPILFKKQIREVFTQPFNLKSQSQSQKKYIFYKNKKFKINLIHKNQVPV